MEDFNIEESLTSDTEGEITLQTPEARTSEEYNSYMSSVLAIAATPLQGDERSVVENYFKTADYTLQMLRDGQESVLRDNLKMEANDRAIQEYTDLVQSEMTNPEADINMLQGAIDLIQVTEQERRDDAVERMVIQNIEDYALANPDHQAVVLSMMQDEGLVESYENASDYMRDQLERREILKAEAGKLAADYEDQAWYGKAIDFLAQLIPLNVMTSVDDLPGQTDKFLSASGESLLETSDTLMNVDRETFNQMVPEVFRRIREDSAWIGENLAIGSNNAQRLLDINASQAKVENALDYLDAALLGVDIATLGGAKAVGAMSKSGLLRVGKARELAKDVTVTTIEDTSGTAQSAVLKETTKDTAFDEAQPSATKTTEEDAPGLEVSISNAVTQELEKQTELAKVLKGELDDVGRLSQDDFELMVKETEAKIKDQYGNVIDFKVIDPKLAGKKVGIKKVEGIPYLVALLGSKGGTKGFVNKGLASAWVKRNGVEGAEVIQGTDGAWYAKTTMRMDEQKYLKLNENETTASGPLSRFLRSPASFMPDFLQSRAVQSGFKTARIKKILSPMMEPIQALNKKQKEAIQAVWERGNEANKWYNDSEFVANFEELNNRLPTQGELLGYKTLKNINDMDYMLINHDMYLRNSLEGWQTGRADLPELSILPTNMKKVEDVSDVSNALMYDSRNTSVLGGKQILEEDLKARLSKGDELYRLKEPLDTEDGVVNFILAKKGDIKLEPLRYNQVQYRAGGHRLYEGQYFVKMAQTGKTKGGQTYIKNPKTFTVARTKGEAQEWADRWNNMVDAYRSYKKSPMSATDTANLQRALTDNMYEGNVDEFIEAVKKNKMDTDNRLEVTFDREEPRVYSTLRNQQDAYDMTSPIGPHESWMESSGRLYYSRRGKALKGVQEERATFIDPFQTAQRAINTNIQKAGFTNFRVTAVNSWMNTYKDYLPKNGKSAEYNFWFGPELREGSEGVRQRAETLRQTIKRQIGYKTSQQSAVEHSVRKFSEFIEGKLGSKAARLTMKIHDADPVAAMKSFAFDLKLGMFDPSQLVIQTQTAAALAFIDPTNAVRFMQDGAWIRAALVNQSDEFTSYVSKFTSMEKDEFQAFMTELRTGGYADVGTEMIYFENTGAASLGALGSAVHKVRDIGRFPFYEAERWNRLVAFRKAWSDTKKAFDDMSSTDAKANLANLTDKYTMNMTRASGAAWQQGILSMPTQFLSYQARFLENLLPAAMGGNKQWTFVEKIQLFASQAVLYGAAGVPFGSYLANQLFTDPENIDAREFAEDSPILYRAAVGGVIDAAIYGLSGGEADVAFSERASIIQGWTDLINKVNGSDYNQTSFLEMLGGAPVSVIGEVSSDVLDAFRLIYVAAHSERVAMADVTPVILEDIANNVSTLSRAAKMYYGLKYGNYYSARTGKIIDDVTTPESFFLGLGITPRDMVEMGYSFDATKARDELIKEMARPIAKLRMEAIRAAANGNREEADRLFEISAAMLTPLDPEDRGEVAVRASRGTAQSMSDFAKTNLFKRTQRSFPD